MARLPRLAVAHHLHLVTQRVLAQVAVFARVEDRQAYLDALAQAADQCGVAIHAYGLSDREVRLLATPTDSAGLGRMVQQIGRRFVAAFNQRHGRSGTVWDGRFRSTVLDPQDHFEDALCYVEATEVETPASPEPLQAPWSSAAHHRGQRLDPLISEHARYWTLGNTPFEREAAYRRLLAAPVDAARQHRLSAAALHGWVLGSAAFTASLPRELERRLHPQRPGRPSKRNDRIQSDLPPIMKSTAPSTLK
jgi:putative transposase